MNRCSRWMAAAALAAAAWGVAGVAQAALEDDGRALEASDDATVITADKLTFDYIKKFALFENNVVVNDPRMQMSASRLTIVFDEDGGAQTIKAEGKVLLTQEDKKARADVATYDVVSGRIVLAGGAAAGDAGAQHPGRGGHYVLARRAAAGMQAARAAGDLLGG